MKVTIYAQFYAINTFDGNNPNIYYSNPHIGAGILGGGYAGLERDEQGNINGFNPQKFALGFASGAGLSKGLQLSTKRLEKLASKNPKAKEILKRIQTKNDTITQKFFNAGKNKMHIKQNQNGDYLLKDSAGKNHIVRKDLAQQWLETFNLKNLSDDFLPNFQPKIKDILSQNGVDKIHLKIGSLLKLEANHRSKYLDRIKPTLENPNAIIKQNDGALIFVKDFKERKFFASVSRDKNGEWIITSNAPKSLNNVKNKIKEGGQVLYSELAELETIKINANDFTLLADSQKQQTTK